MGVGSSYRLLLMFKTQEIAYVRKICRHSFAVRSIPVVNGVFLCKNGEKLTFLVKVSRVGVTVRVKVGSLAVSHSGVLAVVGTIRPIVADALVSRLDAVNGLNVPQNATRWRCRSSQNHTPGLAVVQTV